MFEKITLEQFIQIKRQLQTIIKQYDEFCNQQEDVENFDYTKYEKRFVEQYLEIQNKLLNYDLSDIPYSEWMGIEIISDENNVADFSKTNANIDFAILDYSPYTNYKSCKIQNIKSVKRIIDSEHFDSSIIEANPDLFISDSFSKVEKEKFYHTNLTMEDLFSLSNDKIKELQLKKFLDCFEYKTKNLINKIGFQKAMQLYAISKEDYKVVLEISSIFDGVVGLFSFDPFSRNDFEKELKDADVFQLKNIFYSYMRKQILNNRYTNIEIDKLPELFVKENHDILLIGDNIKEELRQRYYTNNLTIDDFINNISLFKGIPVSKHLAYSPEYSSDFIRLAEILGDEKIQQYFEVFPELFTYILKGNLSREFSEFVLASEELKLNSTEDIRKQLINYFVPFFATHNKILNKEQLMLYDESLFPLNEKQQRVINTLGMENIRKLENELGFFSHKANEFSSGLEMLEAFSAYFHLNEPTKLIRSGIDFKNGNLSYEEFLNQLAKCLDSMRRNNNSIYFPNYDWIQGEFRNSHPEIFMDLSAPEELKHAFYNHIIDLDFLCQHEEYIPFLVDKNLYNTISSNINLFLPGLIGDNGDIIPTSVSFINEYSSRFGNEKLLMLMTKYGNALSNISIASLNGEIDSEQLIEQLIRKTVYNKILTNKFDYSHLANVSEFVSEYPEIFVDFSSLINIPKDEIERLNKAFYNRKLTFSDIQHYPELKTILKDKNLFVAFGASNYTNKRQAINTDIMGRKTYNDLVLLEIFGNEKFLELCSKYGRYLDGIVAYLVNVIDFEQNDLNFDEIDRKIEDIVVEQSISGNLAYYPDDAPDFLIKRHPELFLDDDAPEDLQNYFYNYNNNYPMSFEMLQKHREWMPYLKDKALVTSLLRNSYLKKDMIKFFGVFGEENAIKLGINKPETVKEMVKAHQVDLMKSWYDKTGGKFIPDFVVMQNFSIKEADKFLVSGSNWSSLMKIKNFAQISEGRDAILKLAYSFGVFDQDQRGLKKLQDLLTGLPKKISIDQAYIFEQLDNQINLYSKKDMFFNNDPSVNSVSEDSFEKMIEYIMDNQFVDLLDTETLLNLLESLKQENVEIDFSKNIFSQIYRKNEDGSYTLTINPQSYPKSTEAIRNILERFREIPIVTPEKAHQLFGGFTLQYDADFREFLLANIDEILLKPEYASLVSSVQKQFSDIKAVNSNRTLTFDLAISYVQTNRYTSVNAGNEKVAEISAIAGYSQEDFNILQQIYNYGKQRTFSSIPRIEQNISKSTGDYTYEILRLDDPLAMAIGTLTDCCQELNDCAEICMEHSMVDKNGRVFVIRDKQGNIVAQSWVWRNKDVLCFDNIEIPTKAFARVNKEHPNLASKVFTDEIFEIYKQAAQDLIELDERIYKELLENGKITQEQYDGLRLGKVTVGLGYNDIAESLKQMSHVDKGTVTRPLPFDEPIKLSRGLYTKDSVTQYILEERTDRKPYEGDTLSVHNDTYIEYDDSNFTEKLLLSLEKLEIITKENSKYLETSVGDYAEPEKLVTEIAINYDLNPNTTRIIMNPNFAIIYDVNGNKLRIGDLLFNTIVDNEQQQMNIENQVVMQIRLALDQIASDKEIEISNLNEKQLEMYAKVIGLTEEIDIERGVVHAR